MSTTLTETSAAVPIGQSKLDGTSIDIKEIKAQSLYTIDDLVFHRSQTTPDVPLVSYPATPRGCADYVHYTARDLDQFADHGAEKYHALGLSPQVCPGTVPSR